MSSGRELLSKMGLLSWLNDLFGSYEEYGTPSVTLTGQPVKSKAERVIADYFTRHGIPYYYEAMATTNGWFIFKAKISRPDFYLPQYNLYVEYWGLVDSPDPGTRDNYIKDNALENGTVSQQQHQVHLNISLESIRPRLLLPEEIQRSYGVQSPNQPNSHNMSNMSTANTGHAATHQMAHTNTTLEKTSPFLLVTVIA